MEFKTLTELFNYIWETRPHVSELSGDPLVYPGHPKWHHQMMHVLGKQAFPKFKYKPFNIILGTIDEHDKQTSRILPKNKRDKFNVLRETLIQEYYK